MHFKLNPRIVAIFLVFCISCTGLTGPKINLNAIDAFVVGQDCNASEMQAVNEVYFTNSWREYGNVRLLSPDGGSDATLFVISGTEFSCPVLIRATDGKRMSLLNSEDYIRSESKLKFNETLNDKFKKVADDRCDDKWPFAGSPGIMNFVVQDCFAQFYSRAMTFALTIEGQSKEYFVSVVERDIDISKLLN